LLCRKPRRWDLGSWWWYISPPGNEAFISTDLKAWFAFDDVVSAWFHDNLM
jgi:hypothetical protein